MRDLRTVILAAGKGTRMKSEMPKILYPICGVPIIQYVLNVVKSIGSLKTYIVLGHKLRVITQSLANDLIVVEQKKQNGTAAALLCSEKKINNYNGDILVLCGDTPLLNKAVITKLVRKHRKTNAACTFLTAVVDKPQGYGRVIRDEKGFSVLIREDKDASSFERNITEINVGVYCFKSVELFQFLKQIKENKKKKEFYLTDIIKLFHENNLIIETIKTDDPLEGLGINTHEDLSLAQGIMQKKILKEFMAQGIRVMDPNTTYIDANVKIGTDTVIRPCTVIESGVKIGKKCIIGPFAHLRTGTKIGDNVEIGNFTEIVRSSLDQGCFMKHFSYLGDSVIGSNVNVGAGTVVANFDGTNKHVTRISEDVFIGCDSVLISPVKVGKNAVIGAGSVITKGKVIPEGCVVAGVPAKIISRRIKK